MSGGLDSAERFLIAAVVQNSRQGTQGTSEAREVSWLLQK